LFSVLSLAIPWTLTWIVLQRFVSPVQDPLVFAVAAPVLAGYIVYSLTTFRERTRITELFYELLRRELRDNPNILTRISFTMKNPIEEVGSQSAVRTTLLKPYLYVWDLVSASSEKHYLDSTLVADLGELRRKFEYLSQNLDDYNQHVNRVCALWNSGGAYPASDIQDRAGLVRTLADEALQDVERIGRTIPGPWRRKVGMALHLWPLFAAMGIPILLAQEVGRGQSAIQARAALGFAPSETRQKGATEQRPELSLVLFDKEGKVLWQARSGVADTVAPTRARQRSSDPRRGARAAGGKKESADGSEEKAEVRWRHEKSVQKGRR
jgi:hypothetical protein